MPPSAYAPFRRDSATEFAASVLGLLARVNQRHAPTIARIQLVTPRVPAQPEDLTMLTSSLREPMPKLFLLTLIQIGTPLLHDCCIHRNFCFLGSARQKAIVNRLPIRSRKGPEVIDNSFGIYSTIFTNLP